MRNFNVWLSQFKDSISDYKYYVDFDIVYKNAEKVKVEMNILNSLVGSKHIEREFESLVKRYPMVIKCIPILLAKREKEIQCIDSDGTYKYNFDEMNYGIDQYQYFMRKTGLFDLLENHIINNLYDYVLGVESGLNSNGRKNRGGHLMENIIEDHLKKAGLNYYKEMYLSEAQERFNIDLSKISNVGKTRKRFDFVVKTDLYVYGIEVNFYASSGSKLNETARSYKMIASESKNIRGFKFVWFTDGIGWNDAKHNLEETFESLEDIYNLHEVENGIMRSIFK